MLVHCEWLIDKFDARDRVVVKYTTGEAAALASFLERHGATHWLAGLATQLVRNIPDDDPLKHDARDMDIRLQANRDTRKKENREKKKREDAIKLLSKYRAKRELHAGESSRGRQFSAEEIAEYEAAAERADADRLESLTEN